MECDNPITQVKGYKTILSSALFSRDFDSIDPDSISIGVVFTNMNEEVKNNENLSLLFNSSLKYLFKEDISNINLDKIFDDNDLEYTVDDLKRIRISLFPETMFFKVARKPDFLFSSTSHVAASDKPFSSDNCSINSFLIAKVSFTLA